MSNVTSMATFRAAQAQKAAAAPTWSQDIEVCAAYANLIRAEHDAEEARIRYECATRGGISFWDADDLRERSKENGVEWVRYIKVLQHMARLPAPNRKLATIKRNAIGKVWLAPDSKCPDLFSVMREGCIRDDHLFPPSARLVRS